MSKRLKTYEHYRGSEEFVKRVFDYMDQCERQYRIITTPFFTPAEQVIFERVCGKQVWYQASGGYPSCERKRYALAPYEFEEQVDVVILKATFNKQFVQISHRDVLGAIMNLGIEREQVGDIIVDHDEIFIVITKELEQYIISNLVKIARSRVQFQVYEQVVEASVKQSIHTYIVSSLRLDVLVASLACIARSKAQELIRNARVKVNHVVLEECSFVCNNSSAISIRGYGRYQFNKVIKTTKKNHYVIEVAKFE